MHETLKGHFDEEVKKAAAKGLQCSQIIVHVGLKHLGKENGDIVKAAGGLVGAMGLQGATCGALTGASCLLAYCAADKLGMDMYLLIEELESRFEEIIAEYPGNCCGDILDHDPTKLPTDVCPPIITGALQITLALLEEADISEID